MGDEGRAKSDVEKQKAFSYIEQVPNEFIKLITG
jgi:hypothetical protein